jgi:putative ubiquitin-RnfH superfamily antitoxin RatB of RatAB toxin-antitoxin module
MVHVEVVYCPAPGRTDLCRLSLPEGATALDALRASGLLERHGLDAGCVDLGVWFKACAADQPLRDRDQVQVYRPLIVDPKEARRLRYRKRDGKAASGRLNGSPR